jgi:phosphate transport system substrate-binding protein
MKIMNKGIIFFTFVLSFFLYACDDNKPSKPLDTVSSGQISIAVDETFKPIIEAELDVFHTFYPKANIGAIYCPEAQAIQYLIDDSVRLAVVTRELTEEELKPFKAINLTVRKTKIAIDAIALIVNNGNKDTTLSMNQVRDILDGSATKWSDLKPNGVKENITVVFDNQGSSTVRYMKELVANNQFASANFYALKTNEEVIEYVSKNRGAIGIIGVNWISDSDDDSVKGFLSKVNVVAVSPDIGEPGYGEYRKPYQAYIAQGYYPLTRRVYILSREARTGLGSGFAAFVAGDKGQRIILKSGLVPTSMPVRLVQIN